jgi:hypothetical protein
LVVGALALALGLSMRYRVQWDLSAGQQNSLSPHTLEVLSKLPEGVRLVALFTPNEPRRTDYWQLLHRYRLACRKLQVELVDPVARPGILAELGLVDPQAQAQANGLTIALRGDRRRTFRGVGEEDVTGALLDLMSDEERVVGIVRGYGEMDPDSAADGGFRSAVEALKTEFHEVRDLRLEEEIPREISLVLIARPRLPIPKEDAERLARYLERGGRLLALVEPGEPSDELRRVVARWGLGWRDVVVRDPQDNLYRNPEVLLVGSYSSHPIVREFSRSLPTVFPIAQALDRFDPGDPEVFNDELARSSSVAIGFAPDGTRTQGPFPIAAAAWRKIEGGPFERETRIVVVGDADFASNLRFPQQANRNFFLACVSWLARERAFVALRRPVLPHQQIVLRSGDSLRIALATLLAPVLVLATGLGVFLRRRSL